MGLERAVSRAPAVGFRLWEPLAANARVPKYVTEHVMFSVMRSICGQQYFTHDSNRHYITRAILSCDLHPYQRV